MQNKNTLVFTNEKIESDKTTIPINYIENYRFNDQSSQYEVFMTYRIKNGLFVKKYITFFKIIYNFSNLDLNKVKVIRLTTEDFASAYNWICLIAYFKEAIYMDLYPEITAEELKNIINFGKL